MFEDHVGKGGVKNLSGDQQLKSDSYTLKCHLKKKSNLETANKQVSSMVKI